MEALIAEIELQKDYLGNEQVDTIYMGGGTPSLLTAVEINRITESIYMHFNVSEDTEITLEVNPDDISTEKIEKLKETPVNRFSIGIQSYFDEDLKYLNRLHDAKQAVFSVKGLQDAGYENISIDLIYGIPTLTKERWIKNIRSFLELKIPHLSAYALTVERKTALHWLIEKKKARGLNDEDIAQQFNILLDLMNSNNYIQYEISNFSREGFYSKHNSLYWLGGFYLGLGPSAHSFNGYSRQWNVSNISRYISLINYKEITFEKEILSEKQRYNEYIMTSLRTVWGCDLEHIQNVFGREYRDYCMLQSEKYINEGKMVKTGNKLFLIKEGKLFADGIASGLFKV
jgi:oxygen-independent coproporphyrinogen-3 oxidase